MVSILISVRYATQSKSLLNPTDFVKFIVGDTAEDIELADPVLKQIRHADATAYAVIQSEYGTKTEVVVHIEFQTDADNTMPIRMAGYIGRLIDMYRRPVHATVIYLRPQEIDDPGIYQYTFPNEFAAKYNVLKIWEFDGEELLAKRILGLLPFTPLMQPKGVSDEEWLGKCVRTIEESVPNEQDRKDLLASAVDLFVVQFRKTSEAPVVGERSEHVKTQQT